MCENKKKQRGWANLCLDDLPSITMWTRSIQTGNNINGITRVAMDSKGNICTPYGFKRQYMDSLWIQKAIYAMPTNSRDNVCTKAFLYIF